MKRICAWCNEELGSPLPDADHHEVITHGICEACVDTFFSGTGTTLHNFLDSLDVPVVIVNDDVAISAANSAALALLGKEATDVVGNRGGDVFECVFAALPQGCGKTIHCSGCMIRDTVLDTYRTGTSHLKCPATLNRRAGGQAEHIDLLISTEKLHDVVLLRIDRLEGKRDGTGA